MKAFISILGTNDYLECKHKFNEKVSQTPVKYVQEDLVKFFCSEWDENSEIRIFLTEDAKKKNWQNNGHKQNDGSIKKNIGLENRLCNLGIKSRIKSYEIPSAKNENEIWEIFEIIFKTFHNNEEVIIDITHAFRSLPMLLTVLLNYAKQLKKINVGGIYYSAMEALGSIKDVELIPNEKRIVPIVELTALSKLQDWTIATFDYTNNANTDGLNKLVKRELPGSNLSDNEKELSKMIKKLDSLGNNIALCRGKELIQFDFDSLKKVIQKQKKEEFPIKPFQPLFDIILHKVQGFENDKLSNGFLAVQWCLDHNLYQQAITLLQEFIITLILKKIDLDWSEIDRRKVVGSAFKIKSESITDPKKWKDAAAENIEITKKILSLDITDKLKSCYEKLTAVRNDVNHAGFTKEARNTDSIKTKIIDSFEQIKNIVHENL